MDAHFVIHKQASGAQFWLEDSLLILTLVFVSWIYIHIYNIHCLHDEGIAAPVGVTLFPYVVESPVSHLHFPAREVPFAVATC